MVNEKHLPKKFNSSFITRHFFSSYWERKQLWHINSGQCYDWAYFGHRLFGADLWSTDYHAWCDVNGKFYDSETRNGCFEFMHLGCNRRFGPIPWDSQPPIQQELEEFKEFWNKYGGGMRHHWESNLEARLKAVLGTLYKESTPILLAQPTFITGNVP